MGDLLQKVLNWYCTSTPAIILSCVIVTYIAYCNKNQRVGVRLKVKHTVIHWLSLFFGNLILIVINIIGVVYTYIIFKISRLLKLNIIHKLNPNTLVEFIQISVLLLKLNNKIEIDESSNLWFYWYYNMYDIFNISKTTKDNLELIKYVIINSINAFKYKIYLDMGALADLILASRFFKWAYFLVLIIVSFVLFCQILISATAAIFYFTQFCFYRICGYPTVIVYTPKSVNYERLTLYLIYVVVVAQPVARGYIINYHFLKNINYVIMICNQIYINGFFTFFKKLRQPEVNTFNNPISLSEFASKRGKLIIGYSNLFLICLLLLFCFFIKWKICFYTGFTYLSIVLSAEIVKSVHDNRNFWVRGDFFNFWWNTESTFVTINDNVLKYVRQLKITIAYVEVTVVPTRASEEANKTTISNGLNNITVDDEVKNLNMSSVSGSTGVENTTISDTSKLFNKLNLESENFTGTEMTLEEIADLDNEVEPKLSYEIVTVFNPKDPLFSMLIEPSKMRYLANYISKSSNYIKPSLIYTGDKGVIHKGVVVRLGDNLIADNATTKPQLNYKLYNKDYSGFKMYKLDLVKVNTPGYAPGVSFNFWTGPYSIKEEQVVTKPVSWYQGAETNHVMNDKKKTSSWSFTLRFSKYLTKSDSVEIALKSVNGEKFLIKEPTYIQKNEDLPKELQEAVKIFNDIILQNAKVLSKPDSKLDFENDIFSEIEGDDSFSFLNNKSKKKLGDLFMFTGEPDK